jgi:hypothetical protein
MEKNLTTETQRHREKQLRNAEYGLRKYLPFSPSPVLPFFTALCLCVSVVNLSCGSKPTDLRTVIPSDSLVYLETNDLGKTLTAVTENEAFKAAAKTQPDFSALAGMKLAVAVTGFQTSEQEVTAENSVLNFQPRFVAVADTNAWNYQALSFTENKLGEFINETYGGEVTLETADKHGGKYFIWTAQDGRKAYALVRGSLIFFGNDESAIEKCLAVTRGEAESITKNPKIAALPPDSLASGYVSTDGVAQISNIASISLAIGASEEGEVKSFIARVLPEIVRNSATEATWTVSKTEDGRLTDSYSIYLKPETAKVLGETMVPSTEAGSELNQFFLRDVASTTRYNLKDPQIAWRSVLLTARTKTDEVSGSIITIFSSSLFEPYGIEDPELFLSSVAGAMQTVAFGDDGGDMAVIARVKDLDKLKRSLAKELDLSKPMISVHTKPPHKFENIWRSDDGELAAALSMERDMIIVGNAESVSRCTGYYGRIENLPAGFDRDAIQSSTAAVVTAGSQFDPGASLVVFLAGRRDENVPLTQTYITETRFNQNGIERRTVSDFGLIGSIIEQLGKE